MLKSVVGRITVPVRWATKPRWIPVAKTKVFRVPARRRPPKDELELTMPLYNNYRTEMRALRRLFLQRIEKSMTGEDVLAELARQEEEAHQQALALNDKWNAKVAQERERILTEKRLVEQEKILEAVQEAKRAAETMRAQAEARVRLEKERSVGYITGGNIDEAIERALTSPVDVEYAVDLEGNVYQGRRTKSNAQSTMTPPIVVEASPNRQDSATR